MGIKLVAVDLDFTLLDANREITKDGEAAIREATAAGITVALASGRMLPSLKHYAERLDLDSPTISSNGSMVEHQGQILCDERLELSISHRALDLCRSFGVHAHLYAGDTVYFAEPNEWTDLYQARIRHGNCKFVGWDALYAIRPSKVLAIGNPGRLEPVRTRAEAELEPDEVWVTVSEPEYLEFLSVKANKGTALSIVANHLGVSADETAAIGDYFNDIPMFEFAGLSAAVENAPEKVQNAADRVVPRHDAGGVAQFLRGIVHN